MSNILITGSTGFIGRALSAKLNMRGHELVLMSSTDGDISHPDSLQKFANHQISHVFHLAGKTYVPDSWINPTEFFRVNLCGTTNVLEFCRASGIPMTFISAYVYGHPESLPIKESSKIRPSNPYALSKLLAEEVCEFYSRIYGLSITVIRPFNVYGFGQDQKFLIPLIIRQALTEDKIIVQDLLPKRDYVFLEDLLDALLATLNPLDGCHTYNIGSGCSLSVREVIDAIQYVAGTKKEIISNDNVRENELMDVVADISKAYDELNWSPKFSFREGIESIFQIQQEG